MDSIQMESQCTHQLKNFVGGNYETALDQSLLTLLDSFQNSNSGKIPHLTSTFGELLRCKRNPPLETIWVHSALVFQKRNPSKNEPLNRCAAIKDLFQLIASHSAACNSLISIVLMSPVIYQAHKFIVDLKGAELKSKTEKKLMKEIRNLVDSVIGYVNVCSEGLENNVDSAEGLIRPLSDLIRVWIWDEKEKGGGDDDGLKLFFPLLGNEILETIIDGSCGLGELAGYVIAEVFLLKCCLLILGETESSPKELQNELRTWAVGSITGLRCSYFFDCLLRLLLGSSLSVASLLISDDEIRLREILYDAVTLAEYSILNPERMAHLPVKQVKSTALGRLMVTHEAVEFFRKQGNQSKALSCINAFSSSSLPSQLVRCVKLEIGIKGDAGEPNGPSPKAILRWILDMENRGMPVFDEEMSAYRAKLVLDHPEEDSKLLAMEKKTDTDLLFYIDNKGEDDEEEEGGRKDEEMAEATSASFVTAARSLQSSEHGGRKRKSGKVGKKNGLKFLKYNLYEEDPAPPATTVDTNNNLSSGSDVENPTSDEDDN